jgi:tRNA-(ms[2]io[6]A)-hydroxylase
VNQETIQTTSDKTALDKAMAVLCEFLPCETPDAWVEEALQNQDILLINHCFLEKCAARSAMGLMFRYPTRPDLLQKMSRLAREELVHFEQASKILKKRGIVYRGLKPSRYAGMLAKGIRKEELPHLIDTLIVGAFIEARSCERFAKIAPHLDDELNKFYMSLLKSEARHFKDYLGLAEQYAGVPIDDRIAHFAALEKEAIESPDKLFRFHSGVPEKH